MGGSWKVTTWLPTNRIPATCTAHHKLGWELIMEYGPSGQESSRTLRMWILSLWWVHTRRDWIMRLCRPSSLNSMGSSHLNRTQGWVVGLSNSHHRNWRATLQLWQKAKEFPQPWQKAACPT